MVNKNINTKMAETLANKEKTSQIAGRNFFGLAFLRIIEINLLPFPIEKDECSMKVNAELD